MVYSNFFLKYSVTRSESKSSTKTAIIGFIQKSHYLALMIEKRVLVHSLHRSELKTLDGGNHKTQNHHQSVVNSISLCYVPDQFIVKSTWSVTVLCIAYFKRENPMRRMQRWRSPEKQHTKNYAFGKKGWINWNFYKIIQLTRTSS